MTSQSIWQFFLPRFLSFAYPKLRTVRAAFANKKAAKTTAQSLSSTPKSVLVFNLSELRPAHLRLGIFGCGPPVEHHVDDLGCLIRQLGLVRKPRVVERELG